MCMKSVFRVLLLFGAERLFVMLLSYAATMPLATTPILIAMLTSRKSRVSVWA